MTRILTAILFALGLMYLFIGAGFLVNPVAAGSDFGMAADGNQGLAAMRADMTAFFYVGGGAMIWGAWKRRGDPLLISAALFGIAFIGRLVSVIADGTYANWAIPMAVEAATVLLCLVAWWILPRVGKRSTGIIS